jgi:hypothetical protein
MNKLKLYRWLGFSFAILLGLTAGLLVGWVLAAPAQQGLQPAALRSDYRADLVLMVAEAYRADQDVAAAFTRLHTLDENANPLLMVQETILLGQQYGYGYDDIQALATLAQVLQGGIAIPTLEPTP